MKYSTKSFFFSFFFIRPLSAALHQADIKVCGVCPSGIRTLCPPDFPQTASVPGRGYLEAGVGLGPCGSHCVVRPSVLERSFSCVGTVTGLLGNILKVKCVHLDSSGDCGADSSPIGMLLQN